MSLVSCTGTQNYSGLCVFSAAPAAGSIAPGQSRDVTVTFQPDHLSVNYSDRLSVELMNKVSRDSHLQNRTLHLNHWLSHVSHDPNVLTVPCVSSVHSGLHDITTLTLCHVYTQHTVCVVDLRGAASSHNMYLYGGDRLTVPVDSLLPPWLTSQPELTGLSAPPPQG